MSCILKKISYGYLTLASLSAAFTTGFMAVGNGTGFGTILSMLQDFETWNKYQKINLVYSVSYRIRTGLC